MLTRFSAGPKGRSSVEADSAGLKARASTGYSFSRKWLRLHRICLRADKYIGNLASIGASANILSMRAEPIVIGPPYANTRRWPRYKINVPIRAIVQRDSRVLIVQGRGNELNEGGLQVFAGVELRVGDNVDIEFTPPYQGLPIRTRCAVRNRRGYYYGVEFRHETPDDEQKIASIRQTLQALGSPIH